MMRFYIDTEFNGLGGALISMALVGEDGSEWYGELPVPLDIHPWVAEHVVPLLDERPLEFGDFAASLGMFLDNIKESVSIFGDWPADFEHLSRMLAYYGAQRKFEMPFEYSMHFIKGSPDIKPETPHHALSDARALRDWHMRLTA